MTSTFEQFIYNSYLKCMRSSKGKPYKFKKNFNDIDPEKEYSLRKLSIFFNSHKEIKPDDFFLASFKLYPDESFFDLKYFTTLKAIKAYTTFQKDRESLDPDSEDQINFTKESIMFINKFCKNNNISLKNYLSHYSGKIPSFLIHLKERNINIYSVIGFLNFEKYFFSIDKEILGLMFNDSLINNISTFKIKFLNSVRCKALVNKALNFVIKKT